MSSSEPESATPAKPLDMDKITNELTKKIEKKKEKLDDFYAKFDATRKRKLDNFIKKRDEMCHTYIASIETAIQKMTDNGDETRLVDDKSLVVRSFDRDGRRVHVYDHPCMQRVKAHFLTKYGIPAKFSSWSSSEVSFAPGKGFTINLPVNPEFITDYTTYNGYKMDFSNKAALRKTYEKHMS